MRKQRVSLRVRLLPAAGIISLPACKGCGEDGWVGERERVGVSVSIIETRRVPSQTLLVGDEYAILEEWAGLEGKGTGNIAPLSPHPFGLCPSIDEDLDESATWNEMGHTCFSITTRLEVKQWEWNGAV